VSRTKSTSTEIKKQLEGISGELDSLNKAKKELGDKTLRILKELINKSDLIDAVRWTQYTPYFNDGDTCEFGVNDIEFRFNEEIHNPSDKLNKSSKGKKDDDDEDEDDYGDDENFVGTYSLDSFLDERKDVLNFKDIDQARKLCADIEYVHSTLTQMGDALKDMFGDHVQITVTRKGVETEEYEHE
jgi:hypothetical protein